MYSAEILPTKHKYSLEIVEIVFTLAIIAIKYLRYRNRKFTLTIFAVKCEYRRKFNFTLQILALKRKIFQREIYHHSFKSVSNTFPKCTQDIPTKNNISLILVLLPVMRCLYYLLLFFFAMCLPVPVKMYKRFFTYAPLTN